MVADTIFYRSMLSGRTGFRPGRFGKIILQVELRVEGYHCWPRPDGPGPDGKLDEKIKSVSTSWRDATWRDLLALDMKLRPETNEALSRWLKDFGNYNTASTDNLKQSEQGNSNG